MAVECLAEFPLETLYRLERAILGGFGFGNDETGGLLDGTHGFRDRCRWDDFGFLDEADFLLIHSHRSRMATEASGLNLSSTNYSNPLGK
jgi:hypothetical protein